MNTCIKISLLRSVTSPSVDTFKCISYSLNFMMHIKCRNGSYPQSAILRTAVPDDRVDWEIKWDEYAPIFYTSPSALNKPWADRDIQDPSFVPKWNQMDGNVDRRSHIKEYEIINGHPINPFGRTGLIGRGLLGRWGPNHAADPIVTRWKREATGNKAIHEQTGLHILQFVSIQRKDSGDWAIPGGMIDPGELVSKTLQREFGEEALNTLEMSVDEKNQILKLIATFFQRGVEVYRGYVDDPRNTDNSWMETAAVNFHDDNDETVGLMKLNAGDDAAKVKWMDVDSTTQLYASHTQLLKTVTERLNAHW